MLKIAILGSRGIPAGYGGFETFAEQLALGLTQNSIDVTVFCERQNQTNLSKTYKGINLIHIKSRKLGPLSTIYFDTICLLSTINRYDVVYMLGYGSAIFCVLPKIFGAKLWINMDGLEWARSKWGRIAKAWFKLMERTAISIADLIIADADEIKNSLENRYRKLNNCKVCAYGTYTHYLDADPIILAKYNLYANDYYLIVCRLEPENNIIPIVSGFVNSSSSKKMVIIGNNTTKTKYVEELLRLRDERIVYLGSIYDDSTLKSLRRGCYYYFHGHTVGGTNPTLLEAMGCGNAIISHDNPFNREVAGNAALYFKYAENVTSIIKLIELDQEVKMTLSKEAFNRAENLYSWNKIVSEYLELLSEIKPKA